MSGSKEKNQKDLKVLEEATTLFKEFPQSIKLDEAEQIVSVLMDVLTKKNPKRERKKLNRRRNLYF